MRAKEFQLMEQCLDEGIAYGWTRALKYLDMPDSIRAFLDQHEEHFKDNLHINILNAICESFDFDESKVNDEADEACR